MTLLRLILLLLTATGMDAKPDNLLLRQNYGVIFSRHAIMDFGHSS